VRVTVGVLTFNSGKLLPDLVRALPAGLSGVDSWQLVIADSGSTDDTLAVAKELVPEAVLVPLGRNLGFAAAANAAIAADPLAGAVLILSPTTRLRPGCVRAMLDHLAEPGVGVVVPRLVNGAGIPSMSLRRRPSLARAWTEALAGGRIARTLGRSELIPDPQRYDASTRPDWATGAVTMVSRACVDKAGPLDETFFLYSEETEFELRAADHGFRLAFAPGATAVHLGGVSKVRPELWALTCANKVRLYGMRTRRPAAWLYWAAIVTGEVLRLPVSRPATRRAALAKLFREARSLVRGRPARHPYGAA
jgi:N-acetylglucosaminyl-diphospho-decaprenol L-rhamnosyltransferase